MENSLENEDKIKEEEVDVEEDPLFTQDKHRNKVN